MKLYKIIMNLKHINFCKTIIIFSLVFFFSSFSNKAFAATLSLSPATGVYTVGSTFTVNVVTNSQGAKINAGDGTVTFNPKELQVVSVNRASSVFNLWTAEPSFSNSAGTITFSGGVPTGYSGSSGRVMSITFRVLTAGTSRVSITGGSILAADGRGTNVLTSMVGGSYTLSAVSSTPTPEVVVEYVPPANTPDAPRVVSSTHPDSAKWYSQNRASLSWQLPPGVTSVRTLLDDRPGSIPTKVYEPPISSIELTELPNGINYFHVQFKNKDGWGKVSHYRLAIDNEPPRDLKVSLPENFDSTNPRPELVVSYKETVAPIFRYVVQINGGEPLEYKFEENSTSSTLVLPDLQPGYYTVVVEAYTEAGLSSVSNTNFTIESFEAPVFVDFPIKIYNTNIPVFKGVTRPGAKVQVTVARIGAEPRLYEVQADDAGSFTAIPDSSLDLGVYEVSAEAVDKFGARSAVSEKLRIVVEEPGYVAIGSVVISIMSTLVIVVSLIAVMILGVSYLIVYIRSLRRKISKESSEIESKVKEQFDKIRLVLEQESTELGKKRKGGTLTKAEENLIKSVTIALEEAETKIHKETKDVITLVDKK